MIQVTLRPNRLLEIKGHAETRVCSAVSCLFQTLILYLKNLNLTFDYKIVSGDSYIKINTFNTNVIVAFDMIVLGLKDIEKDYSKELKIIYDEK